MDWDEAQEYLEYLNGMYYDVTEYLYHEYYISCVTETYYHDLSNPYEEGKSTTLTYGNVHYGPHYMLILAEILLSQISLLMIAIDDARYNVSVDLCRIKEETRLQEIFVETLSNMLQVVEDRRIETGDNGAYQIVRDSQATFDRDEVIRLRQKYSKSVREARTDMEVQKIDTEVGYVPPWEYGRTINEILEMIYNYYNSDQVQSA